MKKVLSVILAALMIIMCVSVASAADTKQLKFNDDGKFTIVHLTDVQDTYPMNKTIKAYIGEMLDTVKPDLVVLGGDNCVCPGDVKPQGIEELCKIFVEHETYFTFVFGNHDYQQGWSRIDLYDLYKQYGGEYCLANNDNPQLHGCANHNLTVMSSDGTKVAYNLYMLDSGSYTYDNGDADLGYDSVHEDQIEWYKSVSEELKANNGGENVPAMAFQHIIVQEIMDKLFFRAPAAMGDLTQNFDGVSYTYLPKVGGLLSGWMLEHPCPGYYNYGQLDAMAQQGDVVAIFSGHDHTNNFTVNINGVDVVNSGGCTYNSYGDDSNRGARVIVLDENNTSTYSTYTYTLAEAALKEGSAITSFGDISVAGAKAAVALNKFMTVFTKLLSMIFFLTGFDFAC